MGKAQKKKIPLFWMVYFLFLSTLVLFWAAIFMYVRGCLVDYEAAQPEHIIEKMIAQMAGKEGERSLYFQIASSRFEDEEAVRNRYLPIVQSGGVTYQKEAGNYQSKVLSYRLYVEDVLIATVSLKEKASRTLMFLLTMQEWEVEQASYEKIKGNHNLVIKVPDIYRVMVNGIAVDDRELSGSRKEMEEFRYAAEYTKVPGLMEYRIEGLFREPEIAIYNASDEKVDFSRAEDGSIYIESFQASAMDKELEAFVLTNAKNYSNFFSRDLPGCQASIDPIRYLFPKNSYYLTLAENYRRNDMWTYSGHGAPVFLDEKVSNYVVYGEDFFSCEVYFDKKMILTRTKEERHDINHTRYYYVKINNTWRIVDMKSASEGR